MERESMTQEKLSTAVRKEQIVETALQILIDKRVKKLKINDIAARMELAPSALYRHFKNRDAILSAILEHIRGKLYRNLENIRQTSDDAIERLQELLFRHINLIIEEQGIPRILFSDELWGQKRERRQRMYRIVSGYLAELEDIVKEGQDRGQIRQEVNPQAAARMFFGIVQPAALLWHMSEGRFDLENHMKNGWSIFLEVLTRA